MTEHKDVFAEGSKVALIEVTIKRDSPKNFSAILTLTGTCGGKEKVTKCWSHTTYEKVLKELQHLRDDYVRDNIVKVDEFIINGKRPS